jgi:predicted  nucleic acid-binding Zn-ribbon protein
MTDNEIIKALECCFVESDCTECPLHKKYEKDCLEEAATKALDLINRQKAEMEKMKLIIESLNFVISDLQKELEAARLNILPETFEYLYKETAKAPILVGLADSRCPNCHNWLPFDRLNGKIENAPKRCPECGQKLLWR